MSDQPKVHARQMRTAPPGSVYIGLVLGQSVQDRRAWRPRYGL
jgi:hypothetical protein